MTRLKNRVEVVETPQDEAHPKEPPVIIDWTIVFFKTLGAIAIETVKHPLTMSVIDRRTGTIQNGQAPKSEHGRPKGRA